MKKVVVCDALRLAVITVNHWPFPLLVKHGGGSVPVGLTKVFGNAAPVQTAAPVYIAAPPCGLVLVWAAATVARNMQSTKLTQIFLMGLFILFAKPAFSFPSAFAKRRGELLRAFRQFWFLVLVRRGIAA